MAQAGKSSYFVTVVLPYGFVGRITIRLNRTYIPLQYAADYLSTSGTFFISKERKFVPGIHESPHIFFLYMAGIFIDYGNCSFVNVQIITFQDFSLYGMIKPFQSVYCRTAPVILYHHNLVNNH